MGPGLGFRAQAWAAWKGLFGGPRCCWICHLWFFHLVSARGVIFTMERPGQHPKLQVCGVASWKRNIGSADREMCQGTSVLPGVWPGPNALCFGGCVAFLGEKQTAKGQPPCWGVPTKCHPFQKTRENKSFRGADLAGLLAGLLWGCGRLHLGFKMSSALDLSDSPQLFSIKPTWSGALWELMRCC